MDRDEQEKTGERFGYTSRWVDRTIPDNRIVRVCGVGHHAAGALVGGSRRIVTEPSRKHQYTYGRRLRATTTARPAVLKSKWRAGMRP